MHGKTSMVKIRNWLKVNYFSFGRLSENVDCNMYLKKLNFNRYFSHIFE